MITFSVSKSVISLLHAECQTGVSTLDLERALNSRIRETINSLGFANDPKALSKLTVDKALTLAKFSERQVATVNGEARPWLAFVSFSRAADRLAFDWPGSTLASLPNTPEFETLRMWARSLRPRAEKPAQEPAPAPAPNANAGANASTSTNVAPNVNA